VRRATERGRPVAVVVKHAAYATLALIFAGCSSGARSCSCSGGASGSIGSAGTRDFTEVETIGTGTPPLVDLRVARWAGLRYRDVVETVGSIALEGQPIVPGPTMKVTLDHEVLRGSADPITERRDGAVARLVEERVVLADVSVRYDPLPKPMLDAWNLSLVPLRGSSFIQRVMEGGNVAFAESELFLGGKPPPELKKALDGALQDIRRFPFRLPPVPVGVGGKWRFQDDVEANGVKVSEVADMTVKSVDATSAVIDLHVQQQAAHQEVPNPVKPGEMATLERFEGDGRGEITVDRITAVTVGGQLLTTARLTLSDVENGQRRAATLVGASFLRVTGTVFGDDDGGSAAANPAPTPRGVAP